MSDLIKLADVFGEGFVADIKKNLPTQNEVMQYHVTQWVVNEVDLFIHRQAPDTQDSFRRSKDIVLQELGECCQMIRTVCEGEHEGFCIYSDSVRPITNFKNCKEKKKMDKKTAENVNIHDVEESLINITRLYMKMHGGSIPSTSEERENAKNLIQSLAKDVIEWSEIYSSFFSK